MIQFDFKHIYLSLSWNLILDTVYLHVVTRPCQAKPGLRQSLVVERQVSQAASAQKKIEKKKEDEAVAPTTPPELLEKAKETTTKPLQEVEIIAASPVPMIPKPPNHPPPHDPPPDHPTPRQREPLHNVENLVRIWLSWLLICLQLRALIDLWFHSCLNFEHLFELYRFCTWHNWNLTWHFKIRREILEDYHSSPTVVTNFSLLPLELRRPMLCLGGNGRRCLISCIRDEFWKSASIRHSNKL